MRIVEVDEEPFDRWITRGSTIVRGEFLYGDYIPLYQPVKCDARMLYSFLFQQVIAALGGQRKRVANKYSTTGFIMLSPTRSAHGAICLNIWFSDYYYMNSVIFCCLQTHIHGLSTVISIDI